MHLQGIITGKHIELARNPGIPEGMMILVDLHVFTPSFQEQLALVDQLCGAWVHDPSIASIFGEINEQRHHSRPRQISFNVPS